MNAGRLKSKNVYDRKTLGTRAEFLCWLVAGLITLLALAKCDLESRNYTQMLMIMIMTDTAVPLSFIIRNYLLFSPKTIKALYLMSFMTKKSCSQRDAAQSFKDIKDICQSVLLRFHDLALLAGSQKTKYSRCPPNRIQI